MKIIMGIDREFDHGLDEQLQNLRGQTFAGFDDKPFKLETLCDLSDDLNDAVRFLAKKYCHKHGVK